jgi:hypothetical protein
MHKTVMALSDFTRHPKYGRCNEPEKAKQSVWQFGGGNMPRLAFGFDSGVVS